MYCRAREWAHRWAAGYTDGVTRFGAMGYDKGALSIGRNQYGVLQAVSLKH